MNSKLTEIKISETQESIISNERSTFKIRESNMQLSKLTKELKIAETIMKTPDTFLSAPFINSVGRLKQICDKIEEEESALLSMTKNRDFRGMNTFLEKTTSQKIHDLTIEFEKTLCTFIPEDKGKIVEKLMLNSGGTMETVNKQYRVLFGKGRWFELVCHGIIATSLRKSITEFILKSDQEVLGRTGFWHETDLILMTQDYSAIFEVKSDTWGRNDVLKIIAQREDVGSDIGVLLTLQKSPQNFVPASKAHRIKVFSFYDNGVEGFKKWISNEI